MASDDYLTVSLTFGYDRVPILSEVDFTVPNGSVLGVLGHNGAGKTTLLKCLCSLLPIKSGVEWKDPSSRGSLVESPLFEPEMTVLKTLHQVLHWRGLPINDCSTVLESVGLIEHTNTPTKKLSMGQKQRLGLARVLISNPDNIILDEPTNGLDPQGIVDVRKTIQDLHSDGHNIIFASHLISEIIACCTHVLVLSSGTVAYFGSLTGLSETSGVMIDADDKDALKEFCLNHSLSFAETPLGLLVQTETHPKEFNKQLAQSNIWVHRLHQHDSNLEETLLSMMGQS